jgi:hypothetical protein
LGNQARVVGFFIDHEDADAEDIEGFINSATIFATQENIRFGIVKKSSLIKELKKRHP